MPKSYILQFFPITFAAALLYALPSFAVVPALPPVKVVELPPPNVKPIAPHELAPPNLKPVVVIELKPLTPKEAPYLEDTKNILLASNESNSASNNNKASAPVVAKTSMAKAAVPATLANQPTVYPRSTKASDYNPQSY